MAVAVDEIECRLYLFFPLLLLLVLQRIKIEE